jgi:phage tail-like protein
MTEEAAAGAADSVITAARFSLTIDGVAIAQFSELIAISSEVEPIEVVERDADMTFLKQLPGKRKPPTVILRRGKNQEVGIFAWHQTVVEGQLTEARKSCTLTMYNASGETAAKYYLESAWPSKVEISAAEAGPKGSLIETVTLTCDTLQRVAP